ncbi:hypothetical protein [Francisella orientalis]|uniref:hypothetical protein n=1 Tax=Francisella orientalis TaxID=299583 RepID=UPI0012BABE52|nr:hypothetical protein [Francisella orientalis]MBK2005405.1 hypothetical protein [Francisella orientalis]MBK2082950.1 hypothetical protein [Francisella orientalis]MBK2088235.1 hypothetical protein [Francisella orientalis]MBK2099660.1 hypothetical protein [Francisella orientalis]MBK2115239.1 hypothetical protein [Francisella orientalis]
MLRESRFQNGFRTGRYYRGVDAFKKTKSFQSIMWNISYGEISVMVGGLKKVVILPSSKK